MSKFLPASGFIWIDPKEFDLNKYTSNSSKECILKVDLEYPKGLQELHSDYHLAPDKIEIKREMVSEYQLKIADLWKKIYLKLGLKLKKKTSHFRIQSITMVKTIY